MDHQRRPYVWCLRRSHCASLSTFSLSSRIPTFLINLRQQGSIGTCGAPQTYAIPGSSKFTGSIHHSSQLDKVDLENQRLIIIGSGASGVEAAELAVSKGAKEVTVLARDDKWIIPRNTAFDIALALKPYGAETRLSWIPEQSVAPLLVEMMLI